MNTMNYKGYAARIECDERDDIFAAGIHDIVGFHADTVKELHAAGAARGARRSVTSCGARRQKSQSMGSKKKIIKEATQA